MPIKSLRLQLFLLFVVFFALSCYFSPSIRGSDQYWYEGDINRVLFQDGLFRSNSLFPESMPGDVSALPLPWVQNKPVSYLVLVFAAVVRNTHVAWLLLNSICLFIAAFFTASVLKIERRRLLLFVGIFVFFPLNFYLASQALPEIFILFLIAAIHYLILRQPINIKNLLWLGAVTGILICQRPNYALLLPLLPLFLHFSDRKNIVKNVGVFISVAMLVVVTGNTLLLQHLPKAPSVIDTIVNNVQGKSNMGAFFSDARATLSFADLMLLLLHKFHDGMVIQFEIIGIGSLMFYFINVLLIGIAGVLIRKELKNKTVLLCLLFIAIHFITISVFYNQYRYAAAIIPSLFVLNFIWFHGLGRLSNFKQPLKWIFLIFFVLLSFGLGYKVRQESIAEAKVDATLIEKRKSENIQAVMCAWNNGGGLSAGYCMSPKTVFFYPDDFDSKAWINTANKIGATHGIIFSAKSKLFNELKPLMENPQVIPQSKMILFRIRNIRQNKI